MKRLFWVVAGVTIGALVVRKLSQKAQQLTPKGLAEQAQQQAAGIGESIRAFADDVRAGIAQREIELQEALLQPDGRAPGSDNGYSGIDREAAARLARDPDAQWSEQHDDTPGSTRDWER